MSDAEPLNQAFRQFAAHPDDLLHGACLVAEAMRMPVDRSWVDGELARLAAGVGQESSAEDVIAYLAQQGFRGADTYYHPENSSIEHVLRTRRGIPITLAIVVQEIARRVGLDAAGINFPRHFLVRVDDQLVDPFQMTTIEERALQDAGKTGEAAGRSDALLSTASVVDTVLRMLNNLKMLAQQREDHAAALDLSGFQLLLTEQKLPIHIERVDLWLAAGVPEMARIELDQAIALTDDERVRSVLTARRMSISETPSRLN